MIVSGLPVKMISAGPREHRARDHNGQALAYVYFDGEPDRALRGKRPWREGCELSVSDGAQGRPDR